MAIRRLEPREWNAFCVRVSKGFIGKSVEIEIASLQVGAQPEARRLPLGGMSYDARNDVFELLLGELDHLIQSPRELYVDEATLGTVFLQIIDADGVRQIVTLTEPLMLPSPHPHY